MPDFFSASHLSKANLSLWTVWFVVLSCEIAHDCIRHANRPESHVSIYSKMFTHSFVSTRTKKDPKRAWWTCDHKSLVFPQQIRSLETREGWELSFSARLPQVPRRSSVQILKPICFSTSFHSFTISPTCSPAADWACSPTNKTNPSSPGYHVGYHQVWSPGHGLPSPSWSTPAQLLC